MEVPKIPKLKSVHTGIQTEVFSDYVLHNLLKSLNISSGSNFLNIGS